MPGDLGVMEVGNNGAISAEKAGFSSLDPYFLSTAPSHQRASEKYQFFCFPFCKALFFPFLLFREK